MRVKCFYGDNIPTALAKAKAELGRDAVIVKINKQRRKGLLGFFKPPMVEVVAAADHERSTPSADLSASRPAYGLSTSEPQKKTMDDDRLLSDQLAELRNMLQEQSSAKQAQNQVYPGYFQVLYERLIDKGVTPELSREMLEQSMVQVEQTRWGDSRVVKDVVLSSIARRVDDLQRDFPRKNARIALIGPTGVGKTTTIAKLASIFSILEEKSVALITIDTFRVGAVEQLRTYADIISVPLEVARTPQELTSVLEKHEDKDVVLVDTAGRSPYNKLEIAKTKGFLDACPGLQPYLVLNAAANPKDLLETLNRYKGFSIASMIFTKIDETRNFGTIFNMINENNLGVAYITTGQNVPDDIEVPTPEKIAELILQGSEIADGSSGEFACHGLQDESQASDTDPGAFAGV